MAEVECPVGGCDYSGPVGSVEAHLSGSTEGEHSGSTGRDFREELVEEAENTAEAGSTEGSETKDGGEESAVEPISDDGETAGEGSGSATPAAALPLLATGGAVSGLGEDGLNWTLIAVALGLVALLYLSRGGSSTDDAGTEQAVDDDQEELEGGGLRA